MNQLLDVKWNNHKSSTFKVTIIIIIILNNNPCVILYIY